jgi:hypothetical protein
MSSYKEACQVTKETDKLFTAYDFHPSDLVVIGHEEGTQLVYKSAFLKEWKDYIFVFTEHHGTLVYHKYDLSYYNQYTTKEIEKLKFTFHKDICQDCKIEFKVEDLRYGYHPERYEEISILCNGCYEKACDLP